MAMKALDLFQAYSQNKLPQEGGYIVSSFFQDNSAYSRYEIVAYNGVKALYLTEDGLTFQTDGNKLFILAEPANYSAKHMEPFRRDTRHQIPHRFAEMEIFTSKNQTRIMVSRDPVLAYSAFTILKPKGIDFSFIFYNLPNVLETLGSFFEKTLNQEANVPKADAAQAVASIIAGLKKFTIWSEPK